MRQPVTLSLEEELWIKFKQFCIGIKKDASDLVEEFMEKELKKKGDKDGERISSKD